MNVVNKNTAASRRTGTWACMVLTGVILAAAGGQARADLVLNSAEREVSAVTPAPPQFIVTDVAQALLLDPSVTFSGPGTFTETVSAGPPGIANASQDSYLTVSSNTLTAGGTGSASVESVGVTVVPLPFPPPIGGPDITSSIVPGTFTATGINPFEDQLSALSRFEIYFTPSVASVYSLTNGVLTATLTDGAGLADDVGPTAASSFLFEEVGGATLFDETGPSTFSGTGNLTAGTMYHLVASASASAGLVGAFLPIMTPTIDLTANGPTVGTNFNTIGSSASSSWSFDLVVRAVPAPGAALLGLIGFGALGWAWVRRRFR